MSPVYTLGARFDERRNTSRVFGVDPQAQDAAARESARFRNRCPRMVAWLRAGAPPIRSDDDHRKWFACAYKQGELT